MYTLTDRWIWQEMGKNIRQETERSGGEVDERKQELWEMQSYVLALALVLIILTVPDVY